MPKSYKSRQTQIFTTMKKRTLSTIVMAGLLIASVNVFSQVPVQIMGASASTSFTGTTPAMAYDYTGTWPNITPVTTTGWKPSSTSTADYIVFDLGASNTKILKSIYLNWASSPMYVDVQGATSLSGPWDPIGHDYSGSNNFCGSTPNEGIVLSCTKAYQYIKLLNFTYTYQGSTCSNPVNLVNISITGVDNCTSGTLGCAQKMVSYDGLSIQSQAGNMTIDATPGWGSFTTDQPSFLFNKDLNVITGRISSGNSNLCLQANTTTRMTISYLTGNVGIGTAPSATAGVLLTVKGKILASEVNVIALGNIPDYVFKSNYKLMSLNDLEVYVKKNSHLPEIPSASEFKKDGVNVAQMNNLLLKKVEELTLYTIDQSKQIQELKDIIVRNGLK
jgi:hypothetical protein